MKIANQHSARAITVVVLIALTNAVQGHEGHAPLPTKGAEVNVEEGLVTLSDAARASLGVETGEVALRPLQQTVLAYATVLLDWQQHRFITTPIAGRIAKLYVKPGETVATGQKLAEIDSMELANLQLQLLDAQAVAELSARTQARLQTLAREQVIAGRELAEAEAAHSQNVMAVEIAKSKLRRLRLTDEQIESILLEREPIRTLAILSPIAGVAIHTDLALGKFVEPTEHLFEVMDLSSVSVRIDVLEQDLGKVKAGQTVELSVTGLPNELFKGVIKTEEAFIDSETHLGRAWLVLPNSKDTGLELLPGMYGQATVAISSPDPKLTVPASAVLNNGTEWFVLVEEAATTRASEYRKRNVAVGLTAGGLSEITAGDVYPGDRVVTTGGHEMANFFIQGVLRLSPEGRANLGVVSEPVKKAFVDDIVEVEGTIELPPEQRAVASSPLSGTVEKILVERGQAVQAGDVVAEVASLDLLETQYAYLQGDVQSKLLNDTLERLRPESETQIVARKRLLELESQYEQATYQRDSARQRLSTLGLTAEQLNAILAKRQLVELLPVRAPIDGVIVRLDKALGQVIQANQPLLEIHDLSRIVVRAHLGERDLAKAAMGTDARVRVVADPSFVGKGKVVRSGSSFDQSNRTASAWIELENGATAELYNEVLAKVTLATSTDKPVLATPKAAVVSEGTRNFVFVEDASGIITRRAVTIGRTDDRLVEITAGLKPDEKVVITGAAKLQTAYASLR